MKIEVHEEAFVHRAMILAIQFGADNVREYLPQGAPDDLFARSAQRSYRGFVDVKVAPIPVEENVNVGHAAQDRLDARLRLTQSLFRTLALGDVAVDSVDRGVPAGQRDGHADYGDVETAAVLAPPDTLYVHALPV